MAGPAGTPRRHPRPPRLEPTLEELAVRIVRELRDLARAVGERRGFGRRDPFPIESVTLPVTVRVDVPPADRSDAADAARLVAALTERIDQDVTGIGAFRPGGVYCFQCGAPDCVHATPGQRTEVFRGYGATGKPEWQEFVNFCIERGEARIDRLYGDRPEVIALLQDAAELKGELLGGFGKGSVSFNVLGQVVAGLVPVELGGRHGSERVALTLQAVETRTAGARQLRLSLVGLSEDEVSQAAAVGNRRGPAEWLRRTLLDASHRLEQVARRSAVAERAGRPADLEAESRPVLAHLRGEIERMFREGTTRTLHGRARHLAGERPTAMAVPDALAAPVERVLWDEDHATLVVLGPKGRAHVFTPDGRHVTSLQLQAGELERKTARRWRPAPAGAADGLRRALDRRH